MPAVVIYTCDPEFEKGYQKLIPMYPDIKFLRQTDLKEQILENLGEYTMFEVDDDIMLEHFDENCPEFQSFKTNSESLCLSLRLCPSYDGYPGGKKNWWEWRGQKHSWGYPMADTATIFRREDIEETIKNGAIAGIPHTLEIAMRNNPPNKPFMLCFDKPKLITNEANLVQHVYPTGNFGVDLNELERRFLGGERLSLEHIKKVASKATGCFIRVGFEWERKNNWLYDFRERVVSQNGEDGIIKKIFEVLGVKEGWLVDVGASRIRHSNTYNLLKFKGWSGVMLEKSKDGFRRVRHTYRPNPKVSCIFAAVGIEKSNELDFLLEGTFLPKKFDLLNIDIDGNDYYIWESLEAYDPTVVIIEFNSVLKLGEYLQTYDGNGGAALSTIVQLGKRKGYELISCIGANAFFVKRDLYPKFEIKNNSPKEIFVDSGGAYGKDKTVYTN
jgi:hypothetical protein